MGEKKSYWMKDEEQKGNFSNGGYDTFDPDNQYIGIRLQQGVPLLDRDWNELEDIRRHQEMSLRKWYIGNGTPNDGFKISACDPPADNNFKISAGRYLVDGFEAVNEPPPPDDETLPPLHILYSDQDGVTALDSPNENDREGIVYLDVWIKEIKANESNIDDPLNNLQDVQMPTCVRHKLEWRVRVYEVEEDDVEESIYDYPREESHHYCNLARIKRTVGVDVINNSDIEDLRQTDLHLTGVPSATGVVIFPSFTSTGLQKTSEPIDPGLGSGSINVQLGLEEQGEDKSIFVGHPQAAEIFGKPEVWLGALINQSEGTFKVGFKVSAATSAPVRVRWWAFKPQLDMGETEGPDTPCSAGTPDVPCPAGSPDTPCSAGKPDVSCPAGSPDTPCSAGKPDVPCFIGTPDVPCPAGSPDTPCSAGKPDVPCLTGQPDKCFIGTPDVPCPTGLPRMSRSAGTPDTSPGGELQEKVEKSDKSDKSDRPEVKPK